jgi:hypothetical protein
MAARLAPDDYDQPNVASVFCLDRPNYSFELVIVDQPGLDQRLSHLG